MLPGRIYEPQTGKRIAFEIERSRGHGKITAFDPVTNETFQGEYTGFYEGRETAVALVGSTPIIAAKLPTGANARGILVGNKGTTIRIYLKINPGLKPTGHGSGIDQSGTEYEVFF